MQDRLDFIEEEINKLGIKIMDTHPNTIVSEIVVLFCLLVEEVKEISKNNLKI